MAVRKLKPVEAGDGSYAGEVLAAWDRLHEITPATVLTALARRVGPANGATVRELATEILGTPSDAADERMLRQVIVKLRRDGHAICATPDEGYHHAANADDLQRTCLHLTQRAMTALEQVAAMKQVALPDLYGQLGLPVQQAQGGGDEA